MEPNSRNLGYLLNKAALLLKWDLSSKLTSRDITVPQWAVLQDLFVQEMLPEEDRRVTPAHVAERLLTDRPTISGIIERLSKKGYITAEPNPMDRRSQLLHLTKEAKNLIPLLEHSSQDTIAQALKGLDKKEISQLSASLLAIINNLEQHS